MLKQTKLLAILLFSCLTVSVKPAAAPDISTDTEQSIQLADKTTLKTRLNGAGYGHFIEKTNLAGKLAGQNLRPLELLRSIAAAVNIYEDKCDGGGAIGFGRLVGELTTVPIPEDSHVHELHVLSYKRNIYKALLPDQPAALRNIHATFIKVRNNKNIATVGMLAGRMDSLDLDKFNYYTSAGTPDARL